MIRLAAALLAIALPASAQPAANERATQEARGFLIDCAFVPEARRAECPRWQEAFVADYLRARTGDYRGQRNVAFGLRGTTPGVRGEAVQACAWRLLIVASGHAQAGEGDQANVRADCGPLAQAQRDLAVQRGTRLAEEIAADPVRDAPPRQRPQATPPGAPLDGTARPLTAEPPRPRG